MARVGCSRSPPIERTPCRGEYVPVSIDATQGVVVDVDEIACEKLTPRARKASSVGVATSRPPSASARMQSNQKQQNVGHAAHEAGPSVGARISSRKLTRAA